MAKHWPWKGWHWIASAAKTKHMTMFDVDYATIWDRTFAGTYTVCYNAPIRNTMKPSNATGMHSNAKRITFKFCAICHCCKFKCAIWRDTGWVKCWHIGFVPDWTNNITNRIDLQETRHQLFKLRPSQHASWIGFAMSYHLLGDFATANSVLDTFRQSQVNVSHAWKSKQSKSTK